jgi:Zn finger protein HypA/HybF involved in hydrogenase expression
MGKVKGKKMDEILNLTCRDCKKDFSYSEPGVDICCSHCGSKNIEFLYVDIYEDDGTYIN